MLAGEVRLEVVARTRMNGRKEVGSYLDNYSRLMDWRFAPGLWKGVRRRDHDALPGRPSYFVLLEWEGGKLLNIRDFRYDRCAVEGAELLVLD